MRPTTYAEWERRKQRKRSSAGIHLATHTPVAFSPGYFLGGAGGGGGF